MPLTEISIQNNVYIYIYIYINIYKSVWGKHTQWHNQMFDHNPFLGFSRVGAQYRIKV